MDHLFIQRHGKYFTEGINEGSLTDEGLKEIRRYALSMKKIVGKTAGGVYLVTSPELRATQTAVPIADAFELEDFDEDRLLYDEGEDASSDKLRAIKERLFSQGNTHRTVIAVSHAGVTTDLPSFILRTVFGNDEHVPGLPQGRTMYIDMRDGSHRPVS